MLSDREADVECHESQADISVQSGSAMLLVWRHKGRWTRSRDLKSGWHDRRRWELSVGDVTRIAARVPHQTRGKSPSILAREIGRASCRERVENVATCVE